MNAKRFNILRGIIVLALLLSFVPTGSVLAAAPDVVGLYKVTIQPQPDGTLQMRYEFTNYCATTDFPSADFYVGMPNSHFSITAAGGDLSGDTGWVTRFSQSGVKAYVNFRDTPRSGQCFNFWYEFHQERMAYLNGENVSFQYQPSWFDFATITRLEIWWKLPDQSLVQSLTPEPTKQEGWAIWTYDNMGVNAKTDMLNLLFTKAAFPNLAADTPDQSQSPTSGSPEGGFLLGLSCLTWIIIIIVIVLVVMLLAWVIEEGGGGGGYSGGGGGWSSLGGGGSSHGSSGGGWGGSSGHSSGCAGCAGCACACVGGGRAGCAVKGFKLPRVILDKVLRALKRGE